MLNPWLSLPFQAAKLVLETQSLLLGHSLRIAGLAPSDRKAAGVLASTRTDSPEGGGLSDKAVTSSIAAQKQGNGHLKGSRKVSTKIQQTRGVAGKRRRVK
jgi:hypothetical protein